MVCCCLIVVVSDRIDTFRTRDQRWRASKPRDTLTQTTKFALCFNHHLSHRCCICSIRSCRSTTTRSTWAITMRRPGSTTCSRASGTTLRVARCLLAGRLASFAAVAVLLFPCVCSRLIYSLSIADQSQRHSALPAVAGLLLPDHEVSSLPSSLNTRSLGLLCAGLRMY